VLSGERFDPATIDLVRVVLLVTLVLVPFTVLTGCGGDSRETVVPYVTGLREQLAVDVLEDAGLQVRVEHRRAEAAKAGFVYAQSPREGTLLQQNTELKIWVSANS
jgi:beta-lactam-binding protein with PASTA domain